MSRLRFLQDRSDKISDAEREFRQRDADRAFVRALALAFRRGDHLPKAMRGAA